MLGPYLLFKNLKKGGMARVSLGFEPEQPARLLAVKTLLPKLARKTLYREMFESEGKVGLQLTHPHIVRTVRHGEFDGTAFIAMDFIFGLDLSGVLRHLRQTGAVLPIRLAVGLARDVAEALAHAHSLCDDSGRSLDIVNRDVSPGNVMIGFDGVVKLIDFGIAQTTIDVKSQIGSIKGKISYMAPEQVRGLPVDHRVDIFSLGTVLYEALTGVHVFQGDGDFATMENARRAEAPPPSTHVHDIDPVLDGIVERAMAREARDRYQSAQALLDDLDGWLDHRGGRVGPQLWSDFLAAHFGPRITKMRADIDAAQSVALEGPSDRASSGVFTFEDALPEAPVEAKSTARPPWIVFALVAFVALCFGAAVTLVLRK